LTVTDGVDHLLDHEAQLADGGAPLGPILLDASVAVVGIGVRIVLRGDPLDVLAHVVEHLAAVARVPGLITLLHQLYKLLGHGPWVPVSPLRGDYARPRRPGRGDA
jgi:hypothetical protein